MVPAHPFANLPEGAVLNLPRYRMRVQLQLVHVVEQAARELQNDRAQLAAELVL